MSDEQPVPTSPDGSTGPGSTDAGPRLGRRTARFNCAVTNRVTLPLAGWLPQFGIVVHRGRRSGHEYRTPVNVFRNGDEFRIALTYGRGSDWVRNVMAASGARLLTRGRNYRVEDPRIIRDENPEYVPSPMQPMLRMLRVTDFLAVRIVAEGTDQAA
jgi:deazaflavin-dependent oxidoreductase (nitroreductase family)